MIVAWQFVARTYAKKDPSRRDDVILSVHVGCFRSKNPVWTDKNHTVPLGRVAFLRIPGSELPGYLH
jgi:hypothetical protein